MTGIGVELLMGTWAELVMGIRVELVAGMMTGSRTAMFKTRSGRYILRSRWSHELPLWRDVEKPGYMLSN